MKFSFRAVCLSETWCDSLDSTKNSNYRLHGYKSFHQIRDGCKEGGPVYLYVTRYPINFDKNKKVSSFVNLIFRFRMIPTINKPTRVTMHTATASDHVFTNSIMDNIEIKTAIVKTDILDHFPIIFPTKNKINAEITEQYILKRNI